jgi:hypothetical protein
MTWVQVVTLDNIAVFVAVVFMGVVAVLMMREK